MVTDVTVLLSAQNNRHYRHNRHRKFRRGCKGALFEGRSLPGSYPQIAGAAPLREYLTAAAGRCFRHPPRRAQQHLLMALLSKELATLIQSNRTDIKGQGPYLYANDGSYSLSLGGAEIKKMDCHFLLKASSDVPPFDEIVLRYYDEKNRAHKFSLGQVEGDWTVKEFPRSGEWIKLKEKR